MARYSGSTVLPDSKKADDEDLRLKYIRPFESSYAIGHSAVAVSQVRDEVEQNERYGGEKYKRLV